MTFIGLVAEIVVMMDQQQSKGTPLSLDWYLDHLKDRCTEAGGGLLLSIYNSFEQAVSGQLPRAGSPSTDAQA